MIAAEDVRFEAEEFRELDDERVLVLQHFSGRGKTSGLDLGRVQAQGAALVYIRDGGDKVRWLLGPRAGLRRSRPFFRDWFPGLVDRLQGSVWAAAGLRETQERIATAILSEKCRKRDHDDGSSHATHEIAHFEGRVMAYF